MKVRRRAALIAMAALVAACTRSAPDGPTGALASLGAFPGRVTGDLLVLMDDGSILTVGRDGDAAVRLRGEDDLDFETRQPVWSPDGALVAWVEIGTAAPPASSTLVTSHADGSSRREVVVDAGTFFLQWDPTSSRLAYLGSFRGVVGMGVADTGAQGGPIATTLGAGQPFYLSWAPDGDQLLIHVGTDTLGTLDLAGGPLEPIEERPGVFHAPVWLEDGRFVYAVHDGDEQLLVVRGDGRPREIVRFRGAIEFVVSPDGSRIAYRVDVGEGFGTVSVIGIDSARTRSASDLPTSAFHWSPDGRRLLLMTPAEGNDPTTHRWHVWDGKETNAVGPAFIPSPTYLRDYMPFFGQFAQTMTLWSPDGRSFAFPGLIGDRAGIWVQDLDAQDPRFVVEDGSVVAWSPVGTP
jgi:TolB protein